MSLLCILRWGSTQDSVQPVLENHNWAKGCPESIIKCTVEIARETLEQFITQSMCNYTTGHKVLDANQYPSVRFFLGYLISFQRRQKDDSGHVNKTDRRDSISKVKLAVFSYKTWRLGPFRSDVQQDWDCERAQPEVRAYLWLRRHYSGDNREAGAKASMRVWGHYLWAGFY